MAILVPGCGSSKLSEHLYDAGFKQITNVDFSNVLIRNMLKRNVRERMDMKWRSMDMSKIRLPDKTFDAIIDKCGLDSMMDGEDLDESAILYISKVGRLLKSGGKYICFTLAKLNVLVLLFNKFRVGWKMSLHGISKDLETFMVVLQKDTCASVSEISSFLDEYPHPDQVLLKEIDEENKYRTDYINGCGTLSSFKDSEELPPGHRMKLILGDPGGPYFYKGVLVDAQQDSGHFSHQFAVYVVPQILLDSSNYCASAVYQVSTQSFIQAIGSKTLE